MKIESVSLPNSRSQFTVMMDKIEVAKYFDHAVEHLAPTIKITGFRPGKAPIKLVKDQIDPAKLREEAHTLAVQASWREIVGDIDLRFTNKDSRSKNNNRDSRIMNHESPISDPEVTVEAFEEGKEAKIVFAFDVRPEVKVGDWQKIQVKSQSASWRTKVKTTAKNSKVDSPEASDQEVEELIQTLRQAHAKTVIRLSPAKIGDKAHVNFTGAIKGVRQDKLSSKNFPLILGHASTIPGFDEQLLGLKKGDKKQFQLQFPADHFDKALANQAVDFDAEIEEVFDIILPELNREFAEKFGHKSVEQLKKAITLDIGRRKTEEQFVTQKAKWLAEFEKLVECDLPESLLKAEVERSREAWRKFLQERHINEGDWLHSRSLTLEQLEKDWRKAAEASVKIGLGLAEVAKERKIELKSNEEFQTLLDDLVRKAIT